MNKLICPGDMVHDINSGETGEVLSVYPDVNTVIIKTTYGAAKVKISDVIPLKETSGSDTEETVKKKKLLDKIKEKFSK